MIATLCRPRGVAARVAAMVAGSPGVCRCGADAAPGCSSCDRCWQGGIRAQRVRRRARAVAPVRGHYRCGACGGPGHNAAGCEEQRAEGT